MKNLLLLALLLLAPLLSGAQDSTYMVDSTTYVHGKYYKSGHPKVKRSAKNRRLFLRRQGLTAVPKGYEVDHIVPLSAGGSDAPSNMQLITVEQHKLKTKNERNNHNTN